MDASLSISANHSLSKLRRWFGGKGFEMLFTCPRVLPREFTMPVFSAIYPWQQVTIKMIHPSQIAKMNATLPNSVAEYRKCRTYRYISSFKMAPNCKPRNE